MRISSAKLRLAMLKAEITNQTSLATKAGLHPNTISSAARGASTSIETIGKLAAALGVEPETLLEE